MRRTIPALGFALLVLLLWEAVVRLADVPEYLLPAPSGILKRLFTTLPSISVHFCVTAIEALIGFLIGAVCGVTIAIVFAHSRLCALALYPYTIALKSVPIVAIAPLLIVWLGNGLFPKIVVSALISFFPIVVNTTRGLLSANKEAVDLFASLSATKWQLFYKLRLPSSLPYLFAALRISATLSVIGAIVGEFAGADRGLGYLITISSHRLETVDMFVGVSVSSLLGIFMFYCVTVIERLVVPWSVPQEIMGES